jgi:AAA15 family ATPase/GTPase
LNSACVFIRIFAVALQMHKNMLINFSIQNFGSIKEKQTLSFEADKSQHLEEYYVIHTNGLRLLKLALIYGANASGKTTILNALEFLRTLVLNPKSQKTEVFSFEPFLFHKDTPKENTVFEIDFIQNDTRYFYEIELNTNAIVREELFAYNPKKSNIFSRTTDLENQATKIKFGNKIKVNEITKNFFEKATLWNNAVLGGFLKINFASKELKDATDWFGNYLNQLISPNFQIRDFSHYGTNITELEKHTIVDILRKADLNISNFYFKDNDNFWEHIQKKYSMNKEDFEKAKKLGLANTDDVSKIFENAALADIDFEHTVNSKKYLLSFNSESLGTQRYYVFACFLGKLVNNSILLSIDELESSLHPDLFQHFLLSFLVNSKQSQIIATTHNREILNNKDIFRNDAIWITDKDNENCATELYSLADFGSNVIRDTTNILNAYKLGKLGGTPNLGSYYININDDDESE